MLILTTTNNLHKTALRAKLRILLTATHKPAAVDSNVDWWEIPSYHFKRAALLMCKAVCNVKILKENAGNSVQTLLCRYAKLRSEGICGAWIHEVQNHINSPSRCRPILWAQYILFRSVLLRTEGRKLTYHNSGEDILFSSEVLLNVNYIEII
jgi:hypothetical protein